MHREDNPNYAANRAWSLADSMVRSIRGYLVQPRDARDQQRDLSNLIQLADDVLSELEVVRDLLTGAERGLPDERVVLAVEKAIEFEIDAVIHTEIKRYNNPESDKFEVLGLIGVARRALDDG